ncbi:MAG: alginate lyase family protein [Deltaproteobacteria bacterium]|nr:alginate lyase family protein [Deltaproteobacteria bacterium]
MSLVSQALLVLRRDGPVAFATKAAAWGLDRFAGPIEVVRDRVLGTWPLDRDVPSVAPERRSRMRVLVDPDEIEARLTNLSSDAPAGHEAFLAEAEHVLHHRFTILGFGRFDLGHPIPWDRDVRSGISFGRQHHRRLRYVRGDDSDVKVPWEFGRMQELPVLAIAYRLTTDNAFAEKVFELIDEFCAKNPPRYGVQWTCAMEVGLRIFSIGLALSVLDGKPEWPCERWRVIDRLAIASGRYINDFLEYDPNLTSNHYLSDLLGLLAIGAAWPHLRDADKWFAFAHGEFEKEILKQFDREGPNFEGSLPYHRFSLEILVAAYRTAALAGRPFGAGFEARLRKAIEFARSAMYPDGRAPVIGDNDSGRVWRLVSRSGNDWRYLAHLDERLFGGASADGSPEVETRILWGAAATSREPAPARRDDGEYERRGRWFIHGANATIAISAGPLGQNGNGGHDHNDALAFTWWAGTREWCVDPGTYCYTLDPKWRNVFRSVRQHNTPFVDDEEPNPFDSHLLFTLRDVARATGRLKTGDGTWVSFEGEHHGYRRFTDPVGVRRTIEFDRSSGAVVVTDSFEAAGEHTFGQNLMVGHGVRIEDVEIAPEFAWEPLAPSRADLVARFRWSADGYTVYVFTDPDGFDEWAIEEAWLSFDYGHITPGRKCVRRARRKGSASLRFALAVFRDRQ